MKAAFARATATWRTFQSLTLQPGVEYQWNKGSGGRINGEPAYRILQPIFQPNGSNQMDEYPPGIRSILNSDYSAPAAIPTLLTKISVNHNVDVRLSYAYGFSLQRYKNFIFIP